MIIQDVRTGHQTFLYIWLGCKHKVTQYQPDLELKNKMKIFTTVATIVSFVELFKMPVT